MGYQIKILEGPLSTISGQDLHSLMNSMWLIVVTAATVGYGDFFMKSHLGRLIGGIVCFWGTFIISYFVMTITNMLTFKLNEDKSYVVLQRLHYKEELKLYAIDVLTQAFKNRAAILKVKHDNATSKNISDYRSFRRHLWKFKRSVKHVRRFFDAETEKDLVLRQINNIWDEIKMIRDREAAFNENLNKVINFVEKTDLKKLIADIRQRREEMKHPTSVNNEDEE